MEAFLGPGAAYRIILQPSGDQCGLQLSPHTPLASGPSSARREFELDRRTPVVDKSADRKYAKALFRAIAPYRKWAASRASIHAGQNLEFLQEGAESGCEQLVIRLESISQRSMEGACKGFNRVKEYSPLVNPIHQHGQR